MRFGGGRLSRVGCSLCLLVLLATGLSAEDVSRSRYRLTATANPDGTEVLAEVAQTELEERCRDDDGCTVTLALYQTGILAAGVRRFYQSANNGSWLGSVSGGDGNNDTETALSIVGGADSCSLGDRDPNAVPGDPNPPTDHRVGFVIGVISTATPPPFCVLSVID